MEGRGVRNDWSLSISPISLNGPDRAWSNLLGTTSACASLSSAICGMARREVVSFTEMSTGTKIFGVRALLEGSWQLALKWDLRVVKEGIQFRCSLVPSPRMIMLVTSTVYWTGWFNIPRRLLFRNTSTDFCVDFGARKGWPFGDEVILILGLPETSVR